MKKENNVNNYTKICKEISEWLNQYSESSSTQSYVVGVSGGIDSALVSTLCAMTNRTTHVLNIPIKSAAKNTALSSLQCDWLTSKFKNVKAHHIDLTTTYENFVSSIPTLKNDLANANTKSRLRMVLLYHYATSLNGLVVGTGNKIEDFGVGFFTKYGDGGVDISPIADLTKTQVRECAKSLGIPSEILQANPTDGLWEDGRTDESQLGASYEELEWAMDYIDSGKNHELNHRQKNVINVFLNFRKKNMHKVTNIPIFRIK